MESFNEYVVMMANHVVASRNDKEIESIGSEIKRLSKELEATKREGKKDAEKIEDLTEDWRRVHLENEALTSQMVAQRARISPRFSYCSSRYCGKVLGSSRIFEG